MTDRERLIELLGTNVCVCHCASCDFENDIDLCVDFMKSRLADLMIANGVVFINPDKSTDQNIDDGTETDI